jgi:hypothetical protein
MFQSVYNLVKAIYVQLLLSLLIQHSVGFLHFWHNVLYCWEALDFLSIYVLSLKIIVALM